MIATGMNKSKGFDGSFGGKYTDIWGEYEEDISLKSIWIWEEYYSDLM